MKGRCTGMSLCCNKKQGKYSEQNTQNSLSVIKIRSVQSMNTILKHRGTSRYACHKNAIKGSLTVEAAVVMPFFACFMVFILYFFRILQVQAGIAQSLQYTGRRIAAGYCIQEEAGDEMANLQESGESDSSLLDVGGLLKAKALFQQQLEKHGCPTQYISHGKYGIHFLQSDLSGNYVELKTTYKMKLPIGLLGNIQYQMAQEVKYRKWTGYKPGEEDGEDDSWLYYTEYGRVYHASRSCSYLDLSIQGVPYGQAEQKRNHSGGKYHPCEKCGNKEIGAMVYITDYGDCYHTSLTCSGLKRKIYMIRRSEATNKRMCRKCGGNHE